MLALESIDIKKIRADFPILGREMNSRPLVYLDNAATTQKPKAVIDRITSFYQKEYATVHRGVYKLSQDSTIECEQVREKVRVFLGAPQKEEIIFVRGATEAINLVASAYALKFLKKDDEIIISEIEHHANIVPWQEVSKKMGAVLKVVPVNDRGEFDFKAYERLLGKRTRIVAVTHISNALGSINPVKEIVEKAHGVGAKVLIDGAQAVPHMKVELEKIDCDFYVFSGHKVYGPTGVGVLYGKRELLDAMDPYQCGGDMIEYVTLEKTTFAKPPAKFEAGTPAIAQIVGLGAALDYVDSIGMDAISRYERDLLMEATEKLSQLEGLRIIGTAENKSSLVSFVLDGVHAHDIGTVLDQEGIAIRAGHHCSQPTMKRFGVAATARASFAFYNTSGEIDALVAGIGKVRKIFGSHEDGIE